VGKAQTNQEAGKNKDKKPKEDRCKRLFSNKMIIIVKISAACLLFFCCCFFFFQNLSTFLDDITSYMAFFPIIFFTGVILICIYIAVLVGTLDNKNAHLGDRYDLSYRIVFTITLLALTLRSFFAKPMLLNVPIPIIALAIFSGIITWALPKIRDNDSADF